MVLDTSILDACHAYQALLKRDDLRWLLMQLDGTGTKTKVVLTAVGDGDLNQLSSLFVADQIQIAVFKVNAVELAGGNKRPKIVFVKYMGSAINRMKRAQCQPVLASLREYYSGHHVDMEITSADELTAEVVEKKLRSCGGAFAPDSYEFGAGSHVRRFSASTPPPDLLAENGHAAAAGAAAPAPAAPAPAAPAPAPVATNPAAPAPAASAAPAATGTGNLEGMAIGMLGAVASKPATTPAQAAVSTTHAVTPMPAQAMTPPAAAKVATPAATNGHATAPTPAAKAPTPAATPAAKQVGADADMVDATDAATGIGSAAVAKQDGVDAA